MGTLAKVGGTLLGCVLNRVPRNDIGSALYGYGYRGAGPGEYLYESNAAPRRAQPTERSGVRV